MMTGLALPVYPFRDGRDISAFQNKAAESEGRSARAHEARRTAFLFSREHDVTVERDEFNRFADGTTRALERIESKVDGLDSKYLTRRDAQVWGGAAVAIVAVLKFLKVL